MSKTQKHLVIGSLTILMAIMILPRLGLAQTTAEQIQAQINLLMQQIQQLQKQLSEVSSSTTQQWCHTFNTNLKVGDQGDEVTALQTALTKEGFAPSKDWDMLGGPVYYFGDLTASAVSGFQQKYKSEILTPQGLQYGTGYVGPATRAKLNQLYGCGITQPSITVLSPNGGESWVSGQIYEIKWKWYNNNSNLPAILTLLDFNKNAVKNIKLEAAGESYLWTISADIQPGKYYINAGNGISCTTAIGSSCNAWNAYDTSDAPFSIVAANTVQPSITVLSPNGGENLEIGKTYTIKWNTVGYGSDTTIQILLADERTNANKPFSESVIANTNNIGTYNWIVSSVYQAHSNYKIKVVLSDVKYDKSDAPFSIVAASSTACAYSLSPQSQIFTKDANSGSVNVSVTSGANCPWTASTNSASWDWIGIRSGLSGTSNGTVNYFILANNTTSTRTGTLTIAGQTFTITQSGQPTASISCSLSNSVSSVRYCDSKMTWTGNSTPTNGYKVKWYGTKDGVQDENGSDFGQTTNFTWTDGPWPNSNVVGNYTRYFKGVDSSGNVACTSNSVNLSITDCASATSSACSSGAGKPVGDPPRPWWSPSPTTAQQYINGLCGSGSTAYQTWCAWLTSHPECVPASYYPSNNQPSITEISSKGGSAGYVTSGWLMYISGTGFLSANNTIYIKGDNYTATILSQNSDGKLITYTVEVPSSLTPGHQYYITIGNVNGMSNSYLVNVVAATTQSSITVLSPNGGETWTAGNTYTVTWKSSGVSNIILSLVPETSGGITTCTQGQTISYLPASSGSYNLTLASNICEGKYKVKIVDYGNSANFDTSDAPFSIVAANTGVNLSSDVTSAVKLNQQVYNKSGEPLFTYGFSSPIYYTHTSEYKLPGNNQTSIFLVDPAGFGLESTPVQPIIGVSVIDYSQGNCGGLSVKLKLLDQNNYLLSDRSNNFLCVNSQCINWYGDNSYKHSQKLLIYVASPNACPVSVTWGGNGGSAAYLDTNQMANVLNSAKAILQQMLQNLSGL